MATPSTAPAPATKTAPRTGQTTIWLDGEWHTVEPSANVRDRGGVLG